MTNRHFLAATAIAGGCLASPAAAQELYYEDGAYLYAVPAPAGETVVVTEIETVEPNETIETVETVETIETVEPVTARRVIPARAAPAREPQVVVPAYTPTGEYAYSTPPAYYGQGGGGYRSTGYLPGGGQLVAFDREAWLAECRSRLATYDENDRGKALGAIGGAIVGGAIGNRVARSGDRLAGTVIGAGAGALAGGLVGDAIDDRNDRRRSRYAGDECSAYLDDYMARASQQPAPVATMPGQQYMLVPVTVPIAQHRVYTDNGQPVRR